MKKRKKKINLLTIISLFFVIIVATLTVGYAKYDKILNIGGTAVIQRLGSVMIESVNLTNTTRPNNTGNGLILKDGDLALDYAFSFTKKEEHNYEDTYIITIFNDTHSDYTFSGFNISSKITSYTGGLSAGEATVDVTYEYITGNNYLTLQDNIIKAGERRQLGVKLMIYAASNKKGGVGVEGEGDVYSSEDNTGNFYGYLNPSNPTVDLQTNELDCFSFSVLNTYKTAKSFTVTTGNRNFELTDTSGNNLGALSIGAPNEDDPESNVANYTACLKASPTALFTTNTTSTSIIINDNKIANSIGSVTIKVNPTEDKDEEKVHIGNVTFEAISFDSTNNKLNVKATWEHLPDISDKSSSIKNYYILLYDQNASTTNPVTTITVPGDAIISNYTFQLDSSNYLNETNMVNNNHNYFIRVYGIDEAGNTGANDCNDTTDYCVKSASTSLKYKFTMTITSDSSRVKFASNSSTTTNIYLNESYTGELEVTANSYKLDSTVTLTMNGTEMTKGADADYIFGLNSGETKIGTLTIYANKIKNDINIAASSSYSTCLVEGTKIRLADGSTKNIEDIRYDDLLIAFSHDIGKVVYEYPIWIEQKQETNYYQLTTFSDGSQLKTVGSHGVFSADKNEYVSVLDKENFHVGTKVIKINEKNKKEIVTVKSIKTINKSVNYYHVSSTYYHNVIANNILTTDAMLIVSNMFPFNKDLTWTKEREEYIKKGHLFVYEDWSWLFPEHIFKGFRMREAMILMDKGILDISKFDEVLNGRMKEPFKTKEGNYKWIITTSDNINTKQSKFYEAGSMYTLPVPKNKKGKTFVGWYNHADNNIYQPNDKIKVIYGMYFEAIWK